MLNANIWYNFEILKWVLSKKFSLGTVSDNDRILEVPGKRVIGYF